MATMVCFLLSKLLSLFLSFPLGENLPQLSLGSSQETRGSQRMSSALRTRKADILNPHRIYGSETSTASEERLVAAVSVTFTLVSRYLWMDPSSTELTWLY